MTRLLRTAQEDRRVGGKDPLEGELSPLSAVSPAPGAEGGHSVRVNGMFLVWTPGRWGEPVDTSFPFLPPGWLVDV